MLSLFSVRNHVYECVWPCSCFVQNCVFYFDTNEKTGHVDWTTPHVLFESRAIVDFNTDPKTGELLVIRLITLMACTTALL